MITTEHFTIAELQLSNALSLSRLMIANKSRFQRDFPQTLSQNLTREASAKYIRKKKTEIASKTEFTWAIYDNLSNRVAGLVILKELDREKEVGEFAYCIGASFEGRGWMTKSVNELTKHAFTALGLCTVRIIVHETNEASSRVAEKCGYLWKKKLLKEHTPLDGIALDMQLYERSAHKVE